MVLELVADIQVLEVHFEIVRLEFTGLVGLEPQPAMPALAVPGIKCQVAAT